VLFSWLVLTVASLTCGANRITAANEPPRLISFPKNSIGIFSYSLGDKRIAFRANGVVSVPPGAQNRTLRLSYEAGADGRFIDQLKPDDLQKLNCAHGGVTDECCQRIRRLSGLQALNLAGNDISDRSLKGFEDMPNLESLIISENAISNSGLKSVARIPHLSQLDACRSSVTDAGLDALKYHRLSALDLKYNAITDKGMAAICTMPVLKSLDLRGTLITDRAIKELKKKDLTSLELSELSKLTDGCVDDLIQMKHLKALGLVRTHLSAAAIEKIRRKLPNCVVSPSVPQMPQFPERR